MGVSEGTSAVILGQGSGDSEEGTLAESREEVRSASCVVVLSQPGAPWAGCVGKAPEETGLETGRGSDGRALASQAKGSGFALNVMEAVGEPFGEVT